MDQLRGNRTSASEDPPDLALLALLNRLDPLHSLIPAWGCFGAGQEDIIRTTADCDAGLRKKIDSIPEERNLEKGLIN